MQLSEDPEAKSVVESMKQGIVMLGATPDTPIEHMFAELIEKVRVMKQKLEEGWQTPRTRAINSISGSLLDTGVTE